MYVTYWMSSISDNYSAALLFTFNMGCYLNLSSLYFSLDYMIILVVHTRRCIKSLARLRKEVMDMI